MSKQELIRLGVHFVFAVILVLSLAVSMDQARREWPRLVSVYLKFLERNADNIDVSAKKGSQNETHK